LLAWNDLHERLATLFVMAMGGGYVNRPLAIWHSVRNDVGKRHLLRTAIENLTPKEKAERPKLVDEITWILEKADKLEGLRDDSAHTPLSRLSSVRLVAIPIDWDIGYPLRDVMPDTGFQNPRAMRLDENPKICSSSFDMRESVLLYCAITLLRSILLGATRIFHGQIDLLCQRGSPGRNGDLGSAASVARIE
jgi:hypothetical protein